MKWRIVTLVMGAGIVVATQGPAAALSASFKWCPSGSPSFALGGVPKGTTKIRFDMVDLNVPSYRHGGGSVDYKGQKSVPCGSFGWGYNGPSPPPGQVHTYEFTVQAIGADGKVLGTTRTRRKYP